MSHSARCAGHEPTDDVRADRVRSLRLGSRNATTRSSPHRRGVRPSTQSEFVAVHDSDGERDHPGRDRADVPQSIDSTDYETHYRRRSWKHHMKPDMPDTALPEDDFSEGKAPSVNEPGWPRTGSDGRLQHTYDPDARDGYRAGKNLGRKGIFVGWDLHLSADTPGLGLAGCPPLIRAAATYPAGSDKSVAGLHLLAALTREGPPWRRYWPTVATPIWRPRIGLSRITGWASTPSSTCTPTSEDHVQVHPRHRLPRRRTVPRLPARQASQPLYSEPGDDRRREVRPRRPVRRTQALRLHTYGPT